MSPALVTLSTTGIAGTNADDPLGATSRPELSSLLSLRSGSTRFRCRANLRVSLP